MSQVGDDRDILLSLSVIYSICLFRDARSLCLEEELSLPLELDLSLPLESDLSLNVGDPEDLYRGPQLEERLRGADGCRCLGCRGECDLEAGD